MESPPEFFVPGAAPDQKEAAYADYARRCDWHPLPIAERIYSITWTHSGEEWTATIGDSLKGHRRKPAARGKPARTEQLGDPAIALAIFPGASCYRVVTSSGITEPVTGQWSNPLLAGVPISVTKFR